MTSAPALSRSARSCNARAGEPLDGRAIVVTGSSAVPRISAAARASASSAPRTSVRSVVGIDVVDPRIGVVGSGAGRAARRSDGRAAPRAGRREVPAVRIQRSDDRLRHADSLAARAVIGIRPTP